MATSLLTITDEFYDIVNQDPDDGSGSNSVYPIDFVNRLANIVQKEICRSWKFPFLRKKFQFYGTTDATLQVELLTTDTEIDIADTTEFDTAGSVYINGNVIAYTGKNATELTGVTGVNLDFTVGSTVEQVYAKPADFSHRPSMVVQGSNRGIPSGWSYFDEFDYDQALDVFRKFTVVKDDNGSDFIRVNGAGQSDIVSYRYYKIATTMDDSTDATIPDEFADSVIPRTMAGVANIVRSDNIDDIGGIILNVANKDIVTMKRHYGMQMEGEIIAPKKAYSSRNRSYGTSSNCRYR